MAKKKKLTLEDKRLLNDHVTGETKRCLAIIKKIFGDKGDKYDFAVNEIVRGSPYIEFHPELLKRIPD